MSPPLSKARFTVEPNVSFAASTCSSFAARHDLDEESTIAGFLHAARLGIFELSWNVLCPGCGGVLNEGATLKTIDREEYGCALCAAGYKPTLDEMVEVTFTVSPRVRRIAAHDPDTLPEAEYYRQIFWSSGVDLPEVARATASPSSPSIRSSSPPAKRRCCRCNCPISSSSSSIR